MVITWYGKNCFKLQSGELVLVTDPFVPLRGISRSEKKEDHLQPFRGRADIIIRTTASSLTNQKETTDAFEINYPGEYEVKNIGVRGWPLPNLKSVFLVEMDDFKIVLLGHLADEAEIKNIEEYLEEADILFVPAALPKLVRQLKPKLAIPTLFQEPKELKSFLKELGQNETEPQEKLTVAKKDLTQEKLIIGCLKV